MTNKEWVKRLNDEDLVRFLYDIANKSVICKFQNDCDACPFVKYNIDCALRPSDFYKWLKAERDE